MSTIPVQPSQQKQIHLQQADFEAMQVGRPPIPPAPGRRQSLQVRWAITVPDTGDTPNYPVPEQSTMYKIRFVDTDYARQLGNEALTMTNRGDPSAQFDDWVYSKQYLYQGRRLQVWRYVGKGTRSQKGEWYTQIPDGWTGTTTSTIPAGSQGTANIEIHDGTTISVSAVKCNYNEEIGNGVKVDGIYHEDGRVLITGAACEEDTGGGGPVNPTPVV